MKFIKVEPRVRNERVTQAQYTLSQITAGWKETGQGAHPPFIAGGAVRDFYLGYNPKDLDIFIPCPEERDLDDFSIYVQACTEELYPKENLWKNFRFKGRDEYDSKDFTTYHCHASDLLPPDNSPVTRRVDIMTTRGATIEEVIASFDHDLARGYMTEEGLFVDETFLAAIEKGRIESRDTKTERRLRNWRDRTGHKITIGRPPKKPGEPTITTGLYTKWFYADAMNPAAAPMVFHDQN